LANFIFYIFQVDTTQMAWDFIKRFSKSTAASAETSLTPPDAIAGESLTPSTTVITEPTTENATATAEVTALHHNDNIVTAL
jgi:hypothetical protein